MKTTTWLKLGGITFLSFTFVLLDGQMRFGPAAEKDREQQVLGKELFSREWLAGDRRSVAGDGLGPLFNARSCAACHQLGGLGGAGPKHTNVTIVSAVLEAPSSNVGFWGWLFGAKPKPVEVKQPDRAELAEIHPALRTENSFPLHRFGTEKSLPDGSNNSCLAQ